MTASEARGRFQDALRGEIDLARAALFIAAEDQPAADPALGLTTLDSLGGLARSRVGDAQGAQALERLTRFLVEEQGFHGNAEDYYDPQNSWLDRVLARRTGIPITLSIVWCEVGARAGVDLVGVGFPGHFLARLREHPSTVIDPFNNGAVLSEGDLRSLLRAVVGGEPQVDPRLLAPAPPRAVLVRILRNLKNIWARNGEEERLLSTLDRILLVDPGSRDELRERGLLCARLGGSGAAMRDLEAYLGVAADAPDAEAVRRVLGKLRGRPQLLN